MLIGITGHLGVGKNFTITNVIIPILKELDESYLELSFADQIKVNVMTKNNVAFEDVYVEKTHETRILLQAEGTKNRSINENIWIEYLDNWSKVHLSRGIKVILISDCRFKNEFDYIKKNNGIIIKVVSPKRNHQRLYTEASGNLDIMKTISSHKSECDLDDICDSLFDLIINNDPGSDINKCTSQLKALCLDCLKH